MPQPHLQLEADFAVTQTTFPTVGDAGVFRERHPGPQRGDKTAFDWKSRRGDHLLHGLDHPVSCLALKNEDQQTKEGAVRCGAGINPVLPTGRPQFPSKCRMFSTLIVYVSNCGGFVIFLLR